MTREELKKILPHREPMLLLDEACLAPDGSAQGKYLVRGDEYFLQGHFPGNPIVPGVIQCEILAQTASMLFADRIAGHVPLYAGINKVKFKEPVRPGDTIETHVEIVRVMGPFYFTKGKAQVNGKVCASGEFSFALIPQE